MSGRVLVTGGAGFIGSHIAEAYLAAGWEVVVLDDLSRGHQRNVPSGARFVRADIRSPEARKLLAEDGFTVLNHHAAQIDVRVSVDEPALDASINVVGLANLLEGAGAGGVKRVVFASSGGVVYGDPEVVPTPETAPKAPISPYGVSKLSGEYYLRALAALRGFEAVAMRYANVFGPRQDPKSEAGVVSIFVSRLLENRPLTVFGNGLQTRDYVFVRDVARANVLASTAPVPAGTSIDDTAFNIATGRQTNVLELAELVGKAMGQKPVVEMRGGPARRAVPQLARHRQGRKGPGLEAAERVRRRASPTGGLVPEGGAVILQAGGAIPRTPIELVLTASLETKIVLVITMIFSVVSWFIIILKWWQFRRLNRQADRFFAEMERTTRLQDAYHAVMKQPPSPYNRLFREAITFYSELRPGALREERGADRSSLSMTQLEALKMVLGKEVAAERDLLGHYVPWLATIGSVSPLLGLLGTTIGIINAFTGIATKGSGNLAAVAPGVAEALVATFAGLAAAIPAVIAYNLYVNRVRLFAGELEGFANELIGTMAREGLV